MFTDMKEALEAEALELTPLGTDQHSAASLVVAHQARDRDDLADLLGALGLPCDEDDLVRLLPHITAPDDLTGDTMPVNAFTATAASMLKDGDSPAHVRKTLGLSASELAEALQHTPVPDASTDVLQAAGPASGDQVGKDGIEALLSWAQHHPAAAIRNKAARIRSDLSELTARRESDDAQRAAEEHVAKLKEELEQAQQKLRAVKTGSRTAAPAAATVPAGTKRSKEQLAAIRTWARAHGHHVADTGNPAKAVLDAYDAAHRTSLAEAS